MRKVYVINGFLTIPFIKLTITNTSFLYPGTYTGDILQKYLHFKRKISKEVEEIFTVLHQKCFQHGLPFCGG